MDIPVVENVDTLSDEGPRSLTRSNMEAVAPPRKQHLDTVVEGSQSHENSMRMGSSTNSLGLSGHLSGNFGGNRTSSRIGATITQPFDLEPQLPPVKEQYDQQETQENELQETFRM